MRPSILFRLVFVPGLLLTALPAAPPAAAQRGAAERCEPYASRQPDSFSEVRTSTLPAPRRLSVDARPNGGISVSGWERNEVWVCAKVQAHAESEAAAHALAGQVRVVTADGVVRAEGPGTTGPRWWSVGYEIRVPRRTDLELRSTNGGLRLAGLQGGRLELATTNGAISLEDVDGDVRGETTNGGIDVRLAGRRWEGAGLELRTTNGGVRITAPAAYDAHLVGSTVHGGISADVPVQRGRWTGGRIDADLGRGGAPLRVTTTNGGIRVQRGG